VAAGHESVWCVGVGDAAGDEGAAVDGVVVGVGCRGAAVGAPWVLPELDLPGGPPLRGLVGGGGPSTVTGGAVGMGVALAGTGGMVGAARHGAGG
jgi:hypothetical protein